MNKKVPLLFTLFSLSLALVYYSHDLQQKNPETIFLTSKGIREYTEFKKLVPERKLLIFKINYSKKVNLEDYQVLEENLSDLIDDYEDDFDFLIPTNLYTNFNRFQKAIETSSYPKEEIRLWGERHFSFLVIQKSENTSFRQLIEEVPKVIPSTTTLQTAGIPYINYLLDRYSKSIKETIFPIMFAFSFLLILLMTRKFVAAIFLFLPCLFSAIISLSTIKVFFHSMNMVTSIVPLMSFTIILALVFHLYFTMIETQSFKAAFNKKKSPICLMLITTCIGFGSLATSEIEAIAQFGVLSSGLILINSMFTICWLFLAEGLIVSKKRDSLKVNFLDKYFERSFSLKFIFTMAFISLLLGQYAIRKVNIITDATQYFPKGTGLKKSIDSVNQSVAGTPLYEIIIPIEGEASIENLKSLEKIEIDLINQFPKDFKFIKILSSNSMVRNANQEYSGERKIPDFLLSYQALRSRLKESIKTAYPLDLHYKITLLGPDINVNQYQKGVHFINAFFKNKKIPHTLNGLYFNLMTSQKVMISVLAKSFLLALLIVSFISYLYLRKVKIFFIFIFVNIVPVFISLFFLYLVNFSLNIATVMTYSIAIGMIVDSSFHLIHHLKDPEDSSFTDYLETTVKPILGSSVLLMLSFSLFGLNGFIPIKEFGLNLSLILFLGLIFDLYVLPTLFLGHKEVKKSFKQS